MSIKELRTKLNLTQEQFAKMFNIPLSSLRHWETGYRTPPSYVEKLIEEVVDNRILISNLSVLIEDETKNKDDKKRLFEYVKLIKEQYSLSPQKGDTIMSEDAKFDYLIETKDGMKIVVEKDNADAEKTAERLKKIQKAIEDKQN